MLSQICVSRITVLHIKSESVYSQDSDEDTPNNHPHENLLQSVISHYPLPQLSWKKNLEVVKWDLADSTFPPSFSEIVPLEGNLCSNLKPTFGGCGRIFLHENALQVSHAEMGEKGHSGS